MHLVGINLNILECKARMKSLLLISRGCINLNILECKEQNYKKGIKGKCVLI